MNIRFVTDLRSCLLKEDRSIGTRRLVVYFLANDRGEEDRNGEVWYALVVSNGRALTYDEAVRAQGDVSAIKAALKD